MKESARTFMRVCMYVCVCWIGGESGLGVWGGGGAWREAGEMERLGGAPLSI